MNTFEYRVRFVGNETVAWEDLFPVEMSVPERDNDLVKETIIKWLAGAEDTVVEVRWNWTTGAGAQQGYYFIPQGGKHV
jgi:hypothetical protein